MTSPQVENGFLRIATELQAALCRFRMSGECRQIFDAILLKTYGFNKKQDAISLSQLADITGLKTSEVCRALRKLLSMNIIGKSASRGMNIWHVNKHYSEWKPLSKQPVAELPVAKKPKGTGNSANQPLAKLPDTIDSITKDNLQKTSSSTTKGKNPDVDAIIQAMTDCFGTLDDTVQKNRRYAWLLYQKSGHNTPACVSLIRGAAKHDWWKARLTKVETVYRNANLIANALRESQDSGVAFIS